MASMKLYTMNVSQPARAVSWACLIEGTQIEEITVVPGKDTVKPEYRAKGVLATVPRLEDDGYVLGESHAILTYLGEKFNWTLYPKDLKVRGRIQQYFNWHHQNTRRITLALAVPAMRPDIPMAKNLLEAWTKDLTKEFGVLPTIERMLTENKWLCGDMPTVADLSCYCEVGQCTEKFIPLFKLNNIDIAKDYPKINAWIAECEKLKGFEQSHELLKQYSGPLYKAAQAAKSKL